MDEILSELRVWKRYQFHPQNLDISLVDGVNSLGTDNPLVELRPYNSTTWSLFSLKNNKIASFHYVGIWDWHSDLETGNYVPRGEDAPADLPLTRIQNTINYRCEFTYALDTSADREIYSLQQNLEAFASSLPGFNPDNKPRRDWQSGVDTAYSKRYQMAASVFVRRTPMNAKDENRVLYDIHPWLSTAIRKQPYFFPNPYRPNIWDYVGGKLIRMKKADAFVRGDIVWFSCSVSISFGTNAWSTELTPVDLIRVGKVPSSMLQGADGYGVPNVDRSSRPDLMEGDINTPSRPETPMPELEPYEDEAAITLALPAVLRPADHDLAAPVIRIRPRQSVTESRTQGSSSSSRVVDLVIPDGSDTEWDFTDAADASVESPLSYVSDDTMDGDQPPITPGAESSAGTGTRKRRLGDIAAEDTDEDGGDDTTDSPYSRRVRRAAARGKGKAQ